MDETSLVTLRRDLLGDEGLRLKPYRDTVGKLTIGVGRNLDDRGITIGEAMVLLNNDLAIVLAELPKCWPAFSTLDPARFVVRFVALDVQWAFTPNIANVGFLPPLVDGLSDQGAVEAVAAIMDVAALEARPIGCDFDLAVLDAVCLNAGEEPWSPEGIEDELPVGDVHTLGP